MPSGTMRDELEIRRLLAEYCHLCDDGDIDALVERFTGDGIFAFGGKAHSGRDELVRWFERAQAPERRGRHLTANVVVDVQGDDAVAVSDYVFFAWSGDGLVPVVTGRYHDDLRRVEGRWRFRRRDATVLEGPARRQE